MRLLKHILAGLSAALAVLAAPAFATTGESFSNLGGAEYDTAGVFFHGDITFTAITDDGGGMDELNFQLWDDHVVKYQATFALALGESGTFHVETSYPGLVGTLVPGIGLYLYDSPRMVTRASIDPYFLPHYAETSECTLDCGPIAAVPEPSTYAMLLIGLVAVALGVRRKRPS